MTVVHTFTQKCPVCRYIYQEKLYFATQDTTQFYQKEVEGGKPFKMPYSHHSDQPIVCPSCGVYLDPRIFESTKTEELEKK